jgi:single-strand DNA-binding protein
MSSVNKHIILGRLGKDVAINVYGQNETVAEFSVATSKSWKNKTTGEKEERTEWHRIKMFGRLAELAGEYLRKGHRVYIEGEARSETYTDKNGIERRSNYVVADVMKFLEKSDQQKEHRQESSSGSYADEYSAASGGGHRKPSPAKDDGPDFVDDDIQF